MPNISPWIERFARLGYAAKGFVYVMVGGLAARAALGMGGRMTDSSGALETILHQPFGTLGLLLIGAGLFGYALWRILEAITDSERRGKNLKGLAIRAGGIARAGIYAAFGLESLQMVMKGRRLGHDGAQARHWTARLLDQPFGRWLVVGTALGFFVYALYQIYRAYKEKFRKRLRFDGITLRFQRALVSISRFGIAARAVVFEVIGLYLFRAGVSDNPAEARGVGGALRALEDQPYGAAVMGTIAIGLVAYGIYELINSRYRRIASVSA